MKFQTFNEDYVRRLADGDAAAGEHFAAYFGSVIYLKLRVRLRSVHLIEDIRQETLARVLFKLRSGEGVKSPERFGAFVNGVCNNVIHEFQRSDERDEPWDEHSAEEPVDATIDLDAELVNADLQREINRILAGLPERDRAILKALYLDEVDKTEICRRFQVNARYLRVLLHRAKSQYRKAYRVWGAPFRVNRVEE